MPKKWPKPISIEIEITKMKIKIQEKLQSYKLLT